MITIISGLSDKVAKFLQQNPLIYRWAISLHAILGNEAWKIILASVNALIDGDENIKPDIFKRILEESKQWGYDRRVFFFFINQMEEKNNPWLFHAQRVMDFLNVFQNLCEDAEETKKQIPDLIHHCLILAHAVWEHRTGKNPNQSQ